MKNERGFSLVETVIAMGILATGLLSLAGVFALGLNHVASSSQNLIAREKAREAVESVHTARDTRTIPWCQIRNDDAPTDCADGSPGKFLTGEQSLRTAGEDGLINTADDDEMEVHVGPGADGILGNTDDTLTPLDNYKREVQITEVLQNGNPNPNLRQLRVIISFQVGPTRRTYTLTTFISSIS